MLNEEQREMVLSNMGLVYSIAVKKGVIQDEDAVQYGFLGLCRAAESFDKNYGVKFSTFAYSYIIRWIDGLYSDIKHKGRVVGGSLVYTDDITKYKQEITAGIDDKIFLSTILDKVDDCSRKILIMLYQGYLQKQITERLNISPSKYYNKIKKVRERFKYGE